ncbi:hypothetical protein [Algoriphagus persicinus]|uniref:hypothetical protein n=1 Tax=Algoriphagus persicinus TaxID=3108754 RepID=UPI002B37C3A5|nr:hypothetical protein [Algoriphagus sp. E1-3-M2]MEB2786531.1 hypothetical protein [Algoriphagus sp. E1-3-M2]
MKKGLILLPLFLLVCSAHAQNGNLFLSFKGGYGVRKIAFMGFSFDYSTKYNAQNEIFADFQSDNENNYHTVLAGFGIKPILVRSANSAIRLLFGGSVGSDFERFIAAPHAGFELSQTLKTRIDLFIGNKNQVLLWVPRSKRWRFIAFGGVRFPLN